MNHSIIICDSESNNYLDKNNATVFAFNNSSESNDSLFYNTINYILNNKAVTTCSIFFPLNINQLFWDFLNLSNFLKWTGINIETNISDSIYDEFNDYLSVTKNNSRKSTLEYFQKPASEGKVLGRTPFGYVKDSNGGYKIHSEESLIVKEIFSLYVKYNYGLRKIAAHLNNNEIRTRKGNPWNIASLRLILTNPIYMGTYKRYRFTKFSNHQPIIESSIYRKAQDIMTSRSPYRKLPKNDFFLLSGLAKCGYCKNSYVGVQKHQYWKTYSSRLNKGTYKYYKCLSNLNENICMSETRSAENFESNIIKRIILLLPISNNLSSNIFYKIFQNYLKVHNVKEYALAHPHYSITELISFDFITHNQHQDLLKQILNAWKSDTLLTFLTDIFTKNWESLKAEDKRIVLELLVSYINVYEKRVRLSI
ncbi:MAG: hypothetical protein FI695_07610 [SAR202 cluster bacterium]|nr:hypothetical protein [SAR202 cluster bacterium]